MTERDTVSDCNAIYAERNRLVAFLSKCYPSCLSPSPDPEPGFKWMVYIDTPEGQLSWHLHDDDLPYFNHVKVVDVTVQWDGHTTEQKYDRLSRLVPV